MKPIRRWSPEEPIKKFKNELDGMFQRFFDDPFFSNTPLLKRDDVFTPACNIEEKKDRYSIEAEIPGVDPDDIDIEIDGNVLTIKGERKQEVETKDEDTQLHKIEHSYGSYYRSFTLPDNINTDEISADNKNGILFIDIPKHKDSKTRRIKIGR